ncbi:hypothetical protein [Amycolatopsis sp. GA6-003]|uniref:hypothetical protein n=1 Tax=Amycolatopsis sp. GA6-003 TaxID=2652444 RepID=UPI003916D7BE
MFTAVLTGGRGPAEQVVLVPWGDKPDAVDTDAPWPGRLPAPSPSPATVPDTPRSAQVFGPSGAAVGWTARFRLTEPPDTVAVGDRAPRQVLRWAGPWPAVTVRVGQGGAQRVVRFQVVLAGTRPDAGEDAMLLSGKITGDAVAWTVEGLYD